MIGPDSQLLTGLLIAVSAALLVGLLRFRPLPVKVLCGTLSIMIAMIGGIAAVNDYYGYYTSWGQLRADFSGSGGNLGVIATTSSTSPTLIGPSRLDRPARQAQRLRPARPAVPAAAVQRG